MGSPSEVIGIVSLLLWTLVIIVTVKYVVLILRADNDGEGGTLSLVALAQRATGRRSAFLFFLGVAGTALFYGDAIITPAISVLSAVEGLTLVTPSFAPFVELTAVAILVLLFAIQSRGTAQVATFFGPITLIWFLTIGGLGLYHAGDKPQILAALNPPAGSGFPGRPRARLAGGDGVGLPRGDRRRGALCRHGAFRARADPHGLVDRRAAGAGAELHRPGQPRPRQPGGRAQFLLPAGAGLGLLPLVLLATAAAVIASQAVISGAYSLTHQAVQLGLLPRLEVRHTSESQVGQVYLPRVNGMLLVGVVLLVVLFKNSASLRAPMASR